MDLTIGVTGSIGTGKSAVSHILHNLIPSTLLDEEEIAHRFLQKGSKGAEMVKEFFPSAMVDGKIDPKKLTQAIFDAQKSPVTKLMHPFIVRAIKQQLEKIPGIIILDVPLLIEADLLDIVDYLILVDCPPDNVKQRSSDKIDKEHIAKQMTFDERKKKAEKLGDKLFIVDNSQSLEETEKQVQEIWKKISH